MLSSFAQDSDLSIRLPKIVIPEPRCLPGHNSVSLSDHFLPWSSTGGGALVRDFMPGLLADFAAQFPGASFPSEMAIRNLHKKFFALGTINNVNSKSSPGVTHSGRSKSSTSDQNKQRVKVVMDRDRVKRLGDNQVSPRSSGRRNALALDKSA